MSASRPPGPTTYSPLGIARTFAAAPLESLEKLVQRYGDLITIPAPFYRPAFLVNHPDLVYEVFVKQAATFEKPWALKRVLMSTFGNGLFFSEGAFWRRQRRLAQPAFHPTRIAAYGERMVALTREMLAGWEEGGWYNLDEAMHRLTLRVVVDVLFHSNLDADLPALTHHLTEVGTLATAQSLNPLQALLPDWAPTPLLRRKRRATQALDAILYRLIAARQQEAGPGNDLLSMLVAAVDEEDGSGMTPLQLRDEVMTLVIAGHETTALTLTWAWVLLAQHPEVEARLHEELAQVLDGRDPTVADLPNLPITEQIVKEVLRLYPPAWILFRQALTPIALGGYHLPKDALLFICPYLLQRDARYFDEPACFLPERFAPDATGQPLDKRLPQFAYFPFGGGSRICLGKQFALMEAPLILATIAQRYRLHLRPDQPIAPNAAATLAIKGHVPMRVLGAEER